MVGRATTVRGRRGQGLVSDLLSYIDISELTVYLVAVGQSQAGKSDRKTAKFNGPAASVPAPIAASAAAKSHKSKDPVAAALAATPGSPSPGKSYAHHYYTSSLANTDTASNRGEKHSSPHRKPAVDKAAWIKDWASQVTPPPAPKPSSRTPGAFPPSNPPSSCPSVRAASRTPAQDPWASNGLGFDYPKSNPGTAADSLAPSVAMSLDEVAVLVDLVRGSTGGMWDVVARRFEEKTGKKVEEEELRKRFGK